MEAKQFKNWTEEDFTWKWDGVPYTFKAGQTIFLEDFKAEHFAKHLTDHEMNKMGIPTNMELQKKELMAKCFPTDEVVTPFEAMQINEKVKPKGKKAEKEFADLEDN